MHDPDLGVRSERAAGQTRTFSPGRHRLWEAQGRPSRSGAGDLALGPDFAVPGDLCAPGRAGLTGRLTTEWRQAALCPLGVPAPRRVGADVVEAGVAVVEQERAALGQHVVGRV